MNEEKEFSDIIWRLKQLKTIQAPDSIARNLRSRLPISENPTFGKLLFPRLLLGVLVLLLVSSGSVAAASLFSKPGDLLYPVKQTVEQFTPYKEPTPTPAVVNPSPSPTVTPQTVSPTPLTQPKNQTYEPVTSQDKNPQNNVGNVQVNTPGVSAQVTNLPQPAQAAIEAHVPGLGTSVSVSQGSSNEKKPEPTPEKQVEVKLDTPLPVDLDVSVGKKDKPLIHLGL